MTNANILVKQQDPIVTLNLLSHEYAAQVVVDLHANLY